MKGFGIGKAVTKAAKKTKKALLETKGKNAFSAKDTSKALKEREKKMKKIIEGK